ncbi:hypothetical protein NUT41_11880 [Staphylococcus warneri]|uniref:hypothetical protein n=1 Tax=Staphylococcus warneri TaxID=1292 RepID=UPI0021ADCB73|nr:hypothetical protein [Staphylococcus warneri]UUY69339.1 hypothetical protein NUT41_11880 [Staphylococcus warneri]
MIEISLKKMKEELNKRHLIDSLGDIQNNENEIKEIQYNNLDTNTVTDMEIEKIEESYENQEVFRYIIRFKNDDPYYVLSSKNEYEQFLRASNIDCEKFIF